MEIRTQLWNHYFSDKLPIKWINFTVLSVELIYLIQDMDKSKVFFFKYNKFQVKWKEENLDLISSLSEFKLLYFKMETYY